MPRAETKSLSTNYSYGSSYSSSYSHDSQSPEPQLSPASQHSSTPSQSSTPTNTKKKHVCTVCERPFSTSGHLARHSRVHTGERNHKCPFPGCETRCSRQDNLQQHYRIHLSPGSRRASTRTAISRLNNGKRGVGAATLVTVPEPPISPPPLSPPPLSQPPALEPARIYSHHSPPPDSPPPLAQATLPATAHAHLPSTSSRGSSSSPISPYPPSHHIVSVPSQSTQHYSGYRNGTTTYQEPSQGSYPTFIHTTAASHTSNHSNGSYNSYSNSHNNYNSHSNSHHLQHASSASAPSSRHSISHISHPNSYSQNQHHSSQVEPASPVSPHHPVSPHTSAPPTPPYAYEDSHGYHHNGNNSAILPDSHGHLGGSQHSSMVHQGYTSSMVSQHQHQPQRYPSPSPILPPIQDSRYPRRDSHPYLSHQQSSISTEYSQYPPPMNLSLGHRSWKDNGLPKDVGALVQ
ncbi:hypothetical protein C0995_009807 [Termitomyces sp. Mi166|nr:hypothetical protein C0995_009807 [Termitomyces sp. Mi166\